MYSFKYDQASRLKEATCYKKNGDWTILANSYTEKEISYDANGNILTLQRSANGILVDDLIYSYKGNQLTSLTENITGTPTGDIYNRGNIATGSYIYNANGNMKLDSRKSLEINYNLLDLLQEVKKGGILQAKYTYLSDGTKLRVRDGDGTNGFDYLGSLVVRKSSTGICLESALFDDGVIGVNGSGVSEQRLVNYFITDHLGSVRVIVDGNGEVKERNDYYPFGARHVRSNYPQLASNHYKYNGKEEQVTGNVSWLDYGARMYDCGVGRWSSVDPKIEVGVKWSPYSYSFNNPACYIDPNGMWPTDPIRDLLDMIKRQTVNYITKIFENTMDGMKSIIKDGITEIKNNTYGSFYIEGGIDISVGLNHSFKVLGEGVDVGVMTTEMVAVSGELDKKGAEGETKYVGQRKEATIKNNLGIGAEGIDVSTSVEQTLKSSQGIISKKASVSTSVGIPPFGVVGKYDGKIGKKENSHAVRIGVYTGGSWGLGWRISGNVGLGYKIAYKKDKDEKR